MKLSEYLRRQKLTHQAFADKIGRNVSTVSRLARDLTYPDWQTMTAIELATGGKVTPNDFRRPAPPRARPRAEAV